jgi:hypothetical protein
MTQRESGCDKCGRSVDGRLQAVERSMWRYRAALLIVGVIAAAGLVGRPWLVGAGKVPTVIRAQEFAVVDATGKLRAALVVKKDGPHLALYDEKGRVL